MTKLECDASPLAGTETHGQKLRVAQGFHEQVRGLSLTACWLLTCGYFNVVGWVLSLAGHLDFAGYACALVMFLAGLVALSRYPGIRWRRALVGTKIRWRFSRPLPLIFLVYALCAFIGGILYLPNNYDGLSYRVPRVLHWLSEHHWHWVSSANIRVNIAGTGFEWLMAPIFALFHSDRPLFLINALSFLALPGLSFGVLTRLGVHRKVALNWMWLLPTSYCLVLQAGGIGNDLLSTVFFLGALHFTLKTKDSGSLWDLFLGTLSAALLTAVKTTNLPLLLPWFIAAVSVLKSVRIRPGLGGVMLLVCLAASFFPIACLNTRFAGHWGGDPADSCRVRIHRPVYGIAGNAIQLLVGSFEPPLTPSGKKWTALADQQIRRGPGKTLVQEFPRFTIAWNEFPQEEAAGLGLGITMLLILSIANRFCSGSVSREWGKIKVTTLICLSGWISLLAYMCVLGSEATARLLSAYYPILVTSALLLPGNADLIRRRWWKACALAAALSALPPVVLSPSRPLWPAEHVCQWLLVKLGQKPAIQRAATVYSVYRTRADGLAPLLRDLPGDVNEIGFIGEEDDVEMSLWRPFGKRVVIDVLPQNLENSGHGRISFVVASPQAVERFSGRSFADWLKLAHLHVIASEEWQNRASQPPTKWFLLALDTATSG